MTREAEIIKHVDILRDIVEFLVSAKALLDKTMSANQQKICKSILQQIVECSYFIHDYATHGFSKYFAVLRFTQWLISVGISQTLGEGTLLRH